MTGNKWRIIILLVVVASVVVAQWVATAPTWHLYHREFGKIWSVEEFDALMGEVEADVGQNFNVYRIDSTQAREQVATQLGTMGHDDEEGTFGYIDSFDVHAWAWVWDGSGMNPDWDVVREWQDTWRELDYDSPKTKEAQFCMMGFTPSPRILD